MREKSLKELLLGTPLIYQILQNGIRKPSSDVFLANEVIQAKSGLAILDVGCGVSRIRPHLGDVTYVGVDHNSSYIRRARKKYGLLGRYYVADVSSVSEISKNKFDRVLLLAVLHHLSDNEALQLIAQCKSLLKADGFLISADPVFVQDQNPIAYLISRFDRGRFVRSATGYERLVGSQFKIRDLVIRHDLLWLPSSTAIITTQSSAEPR